MLLLLFFFFNDTATTEIYTLSLHDALPIYRLATGPAQAMSAVPGEGGSAERPEQAGAQEVLHGVVPGEEDVVPVDRKSTRLNSSHGYISYAVFCLKKKKK